ncbi:MAG: D-2-hydroxyacid dehydrogenase [Gammaproteobacteria bacterium]|nr:D-2-hydroxyacid dehydrogenase [Gammaproteobacteria bacterium]
MRTIILDAASLGSDITLEPLQRAAGDFIRHDYSDPEQVVERLQSADIAIVNKTVLTGAILAQCPQLKMIAVTATGTNNIDLKTAQARRIRVCNVTRYGRASLVQHTFMLMLALAGNLPAYQRDVKTGRWNNASNFCLMDYRILELEGKTLGIVGYGDLGHGVAQMARALGMHVLVSRRGEQSNTTDDGTPRLPLHELLPQVDVLSLHCLLTDANRNLIGATELALMKPTAFLINTARGGLVDEAALATALQDGKLGGAATDVLSQEPPVNGNVLLDLDLPNLIITPHCAWASQEARQRLINLTADNIRNFIDGTLKRYVV